MEDVAEIRDHVLQGDNADFTDYHLAANAISAAKGTGSTPLRIEVCRQLGEFFANSPRPEIAEGAKWMAGTARRLELPGNPLVLKGKLIDGTPFDITSLRGKIVLIQCWAWENYFQNFDPRDDVSPDVDSVDNNELNPVPKIRELFAKYHDQGFEVVIVCNWPRPNLSESYLNRNPLPWPVLFCDKEDAIQRLHPFIVHYGLHYPGWGILVDRNGNVISAAVFATLVNFNGQFYHANLSKLLKAEFDEMSTPSK